MKFFDAGDKAEGFIAVGQFATGVIAFGQMATGVIAVGQLARGVIAIGQLGIGVIGWGQGGVGVMHAVGMMGVGGRGLGLVLPLVPSLGRPRVPPGALVGYAEVAAGRQGWLDVDLQADNWGPGLFWEGRRLPIKLDRAVLKGAGDLVAQRPQRIYADVQRIGDSLVCRRLAHTPLRPYEKPHFKVTSVFQLAGMLVLGAVFWLAVGNDLIGFFQRNMAPSKPPVTAPVRPQVAPPRK